MEKMGKKKSSENGSGARVALLSRQDQAYDDMLSHQGYSTHGMAVTDKYEATVE
jgi:hypothetical protein